MARCASGTEDYRTTEDGETLATAGQLLSDCTLVSSFPATWMIWASRSASVFEESNGALRSALSMSKRLLSILSASQFMSGYCSGGISASRILMGIEHAAKPSARIVLMSAKEGAR